MPALVVDGAMRVRETVCSCAHIPHDQREHHENEDKERADRLLAEVRAQLFSVQFKLEGTPFIDAVVWSLALDFEASITGIGVDQWLGVIAAKEDGSFSVTIECDALEYGFAGVYRAFARHAKIMAVLAAIPGVSWEYTVDGGVGVWSVDGVKRVVLQRDGHISWVGEDAQDGPPSMPWQACLEAGFEPAKTAEAPPPEQT
ncbi:MAG: hypothetical protein Q8R16_04050 [bacterium]|nr:hypothetical protein [bacterium]